MFRKRVGGGSGNDALVRTEAPLLRKSSAATTCLVSSRVIMRTRTLVSTARMAFLHVRADTFFKFIQALRGRSAAGEYRLMDVFG